MSLINEGLKKGDLEGMVLPMMSIDEFSSKIDDRTVIVVAFYSFEEDPAHDLSNFIERSPTQVLDTDVSPAPSKEGYYVTFVEFKRTSQFPQRLIAILKEVTNLTNITNWQFTSFRLPKGKVLPVNNENLAKWVDLKPKAATDKERLQEFLQASSLSDFELAEQSLTLLREGTVANYQFAGFEFEQDDTPSWSTQAAAHALRLSRMLDGPYQVHPFEQHLIVENTETNTILVLKTNTT